MKSLILIVLGFQGLCICYKPKSLIVIRNSRISMQQSNNENETRNVKSTPPAIDLHNFPNKISHLTVFAPFSFIGILLLIASGAHASAGEALSLLHGREVQTPDNVTWVVMLSGLFLIQYKFYELLSRF